MRLLLSLKSIRDQQYQLDYHYSVQGFIYNLLKGSSFEYLHSKGGYKFFCFSNIFPYSSMIRKGEVKNLLISSPSRDLIMHLEARVREHKSLGDIIGIGDMRFMIKGSKIIHYSLSKKQLTLVTATPIIVRIARDKYKMFNIIPEHDYNYLYWKKDYPLEIFITQLEDNLFKKYREYTGLDIKEEVMEELADNNYYMKDDDKGASTERLGDKRVRNKRDHNHTGHIINRLRFIKQVAKEISIHGDKHIVIGTLWIFWFNLEHYNRCNAILRLLRFALDTGFGERNSLGFGFLNIRKGYKYTD